MKKLFITLLTSMTLISFGQAPKEISYQGVARNTTGSVLPNQTIGIKLDLHQGSAAGTVVFSESHNKTTNAFGLFTLGIGSANTSGFTAINWANGPYFLEVSMDPAGGTSYTSVGTQQFMSVPYALYAETSGNASATPTITINAPNTVTSAAGSYTINVPAAATYSAGTGIDITGGVISNTAIAITPTIAAGNNITINPTTPSNSYTVSAPSYSLSQTGNNIDLLQNGTSIGTATLPATTSYSAGNGIDITGGVISNTLTQITPTLSVSGNSISINPGNTQALPNYSLTQSGANIDLTQNGTSIATVTLTAATSTSLSAGSSNIILNQAGNAYTITPVIPTYTNNGSTTITGTYPNYTVNSVASPTTSLVAGNTNIQLIPGTNSYTLNAYTYSLTNNSNTLTLSNGAPFSTPSTVVLPTTATTSLVQGNNITLNNSGNTYTVSAPAYSISLPGGNVVQISNGVSTSTAPISATNLTLNGPNNNILSAGGNTVGLNTYTVGSNLNMSSGPNYTITSPSYSLTSNSNTLTLSNGTAITTATVPALTLPLLSYTASATEGKLQSGPGTNTVSIPNYTLSNTSNTITLNNGVASSTAIIPVPTLSLTGSTLTSGPATNSVSLSGFNGIYGGSGSIQTGSTTVTVGTNTLTFLSGNTANKPIANFFGGGITGTSMTLGHVGANAANFKFVGSATTTPVDYGYVSGSTNGIAISGGTSTNGLYATNTAEIGVGTYTTGTGKFVITHTASQANPTMHLRETSGALSRIKFSNTGVANKYFEVGASNNAANNFSAYSVSFFDGTNYKSRFLIYGDGKTSINNMHAPLTTFHVMDDNATSPGIAAEGFGFSGQINLTRNNPLGVSPTYTRGAVFGGQEIGKINFSAYDGTGYGDGAKIYAKASENVSNTSKGTDLFFATVPNGTTANTDKMRINNDGNIGIGVNPLRAKLEMNMLGSAQSSAIFGGDSWGVSLYHNYPGIGFGSYFDGSSFKSINASGYGANIIFDPFSSGDYIFYSTDVTSPTADAVQVMRERLRLARSGAIGVGPTSDFGTSGQVLVSNGPGSAPNWQALTAPAAAWTSTLGNTYLVNSGDKVGIGTSTPSESLDVNGNINIPVSTSSVGVIKMAGANFISAPGSDNLFVGKSSGNIATTGFNNVAFGNNTLQNLASGANNVGLGYQVMQVIGSGSQNIAIGTNALSSINSGNNNTALGFQAGNVITNGANNLFLGYNTNANGASLTNASAIGSLARVDASNSMVLGSINGINGAIASTKIGIGITAPTAQLHVVNGSSTGEGMFVDNASNTHGIRVFQAGIGDGFYAHINNAGAGAGFDGLTNSNGAFYKGQNTGSGGVADFTINNASNNSPVISAVTSGKGSAIYAVNTGSLNATGYFSNSSGNALEVLSSNGIGVLATVASASAAIDVTNNSTGAGIHVKKSATATSGNAGRFEILNAGNSADGIFVETKGVGAAIHAVGSNTTTGTAGLFDGNVITNGNVTIPATKNYKYATPKTDYNSVSALSFNTEGSYNRSNISGGVYIVDGTAGTQGNLYAGVNLPNGAVVTGVDAYVLDNDGLAGRDIAYVQLWRQDGAVGTGFGNVINMAQTPGTSVTSSAIVKLSTTAISNSTIDNSLYTYYLRVGSVQAAPNLILFKVVITYTITNVD